MEVKTIDGFQAVRFDKSAVSVLTYTLDENNVISGIGIVKEKNPHFPEGFTENMIQGQIEQSDDSLLERAMKELYEEGGIKVEDSLKWCYLGDIRYSKISPDSMYMFAVNITGAKMEKPKGEPGTNETIYSFEVRPVNEALLVKDSLLYSAFFQLFMKLYKKDIKESTCTNYPTENREEL